jgi:hypothetical protein
VLHRSVHPNVSRIRSHKCSLIRPRASSAVHRPQSGQFRARSERCRGGHRDLPAPGRTTEKVVVNFGCICYPERGSPSRLGRHNANGPAAISAASRTVANATTARSADTHSTDSHAEPWLSSHYHPAPRGLRFHHNRRNRSAAVSGPACRLRCRPTALAPPNRLLRKLLAAEGLPRAAGRPARNPPGLRPLGHGRPPTRTHRHLGAASHRARYAGEADPDRTPAPVVHQIGVQTQGLPTVCCLCTTQSAGLQRLGRDRVTMSEQPPEGRLDRSAAVAMYLRRPGPAPGSGR